MFALTVHTISSSIYVLGSVFVSYFIFIHSSSLLFFTLVVVQSLTCLYMLSGRTAAWPLPVFRCRLFMAPRWGTEAWHWLTVARLPARSLNGNAWLDLSCFWSSFLIRLLKMRSYQARRGKRSSKRWVSKFIG